MTATKGGNETKASSTVESGEEACYFINHGLPNILIEINLFSMPLLLIRYLSSRAVKASRRSSGT